MLLTSHNAWPAIAKALGLESQPGVRKVTITIETDNMVTVAIERFTESHELESVLKVFEGATLVDPPPPKPSITDYWHKMLKKEVKTDDVAAEPHTWRDREPLL